MQQVHKNELLGSFIYEHAHKQGLLIPEEQVTDTNPTRCHTLIFQI
jgi:hypothetical protein